MSRDPRQMNSDEIVQEVHRLRDDMDKTARRIVELSQTMYHRIRRAPSDDTTSKYILFANTWIRFGALVEGGLRRTSSTTRLIEAARRMQQKASVGVAVKRPDPVKDSMKSLVELYGEEMVGDADTR